MTEEWRPFNYTNDNGEITGIATERLKAVLDSINIEYTISSYPWARSMILTSNDENTLIYTILRTKDREDKFQWICPLIGPVKVHLYKLSKRKDININTIEDARNYVTSIEKSESDHEYLLSKGFINGVNLDVTGDPYAGTRKFFAERVDLVLQTEWEMKENLRHFKRPASDVEKIFEVKKPSDAEGCMAFGLKTDKALVDKIRKALKDYNVKHGL
ncbi:transporter substrate-binding domain-containing protein [Pseudoalteromonas sp. G4]|nr:transporter substrate-binding domain-containing protein [Pseudoalteromonas sp. G4]